MAPSDSSDLKIELERLKRQLHFLSEQIYTIEKKLSGEPTKKQEIAAVLQHNF